jgi:hypothetical protein
MIDSDRLNAVVKTNIEALCQHFFPNGKEVRGEWRIGDVTGAKGNSLGIQLTGPKTGVWIDRDGSGNGGFANLLRANRGVGFREAVALIESFLGINLQLSEVPARKADECANASFDWDKCVGGFSERHLERLAVWRGYSPAFCRALKQWRLIGIYNGCVAIPLQNAGSIVGSHYYAKKTDDWKYSPGCKVTPLFVGNPSNACRIDVFESYWDAFAFADAMAFDLSDDTCAIIVTRGAGNGKLIKGLLPPLERCDVYAWPQRDIARENDVIPSVTWLDAVVSTAGRPLRVAWIPDLHPDRDYDLNDWTRELSNTGVTRDKIRDRVWEVSQNAQALEKASARPANGAKASTAHDGAEEPTVLRFPYPELDSVALYGPLGEIVKTLEPLTEADQAAMLIQMLAAFGNLIGRSAYFYAGDQRHFTNLFVCIVGKTAKSRKGSSLSAVRGVLNCIDPSWLEERVLAGLSSGEGLIHAVRDPLRKVNKEGQTETLDAGVSDKRLLVAETEFATAFAVMNRDTNTLSAVLRLAWDSGNLRTLTKNSPSVATNAHVSILGHITKDELRRRMSEAEFFNGFANRFLWTCAQRSKVLADAEGVKAACFGEFIGRLHEAAAWSRQVEEMEREQEASELWGQIYQELADEVPGLLGEVLARGDAQTLRLSMIYALADHSSIIRVDHLRAAYGIWKYCEASARFLFGDRLGNAKAEKILAALCKAPKGLTRSQIQANVFKGNLKVESLDEALQVLIKAGQVYSVAEQTGGRAAERFFTKPCTKETK